MKATDVGAVTGANEAFYAAFEAADLDRMAACWAQDDTVCCIHPGSDLIVGWPRVSRSWAAVFVGSARLQFFLTDVDVHVDGDTAVVTCAENVLAGAELSAGRVLATNVFRRVDGEWRMVLHHASPVLRG